MNEMKAPSKRLIIAMIAVILLFVVIVILIPEKNAGDLNANLIIAVDTDVFIGSVGVSYTRWDGSAVSGGTVNAEETPFTRGDMISYEVEGWPAIVSVYADPQSTVMLSSGLVEEAPPEGYFWQVSVREQSGSVIIEPILVEVDP